MTDAPPKVPHIPLENLRISARSSWKSTSSRRDVLSGWAVSRGDADADVVYDLPELRQQSRDLGRTNPIVCALNSVRTTNVVGRGLRFRSSIDREYLGLSADQAAEWERRHEMDFEAWASSPMSDIERKIDFFDSQERVFSAVEESGDHFVLLTNSDIQGWPYRLAMQHIEADRISNPDNRADNDRLVQGVEKSESGAPMAYHVRSRHPGSDRYGNVRWERRAAWTPGGQPAVLHLMQHRRTGETRGYPSLSPIIEPLKQLDRYSDAEINAAVDTAFYSLLVKTEAGDGLSGIGFEDLSKARQNYYSETKRRMESGSRILGLFPGDDVFGFDPNRPNTEYDKFMGSTVSLLSASQEVPYEILVRQFGGSYTAARAAILQFSAYILKRRAWISRKFCDIVREQQLIESIAAGRINAPGFLNDYMIRKAYMAGEWIGDVMPQIDEKAAITAARERIELGVSSKTRETQALTGENWNRIQRQREKERAIESESMAESERMAESESMAEDESMAESERMTDEERIK